MGVPLVTRLSGAVHLKTGDDKKPKSIAREKGWQCCGFEGTRARKERVPAAREKS